MSPTLGIALDPRIQQGYGAVAPSVIDNGGDPTGIVTGIVWRSWGASQAVGTGVSLYVGSDQDVAEGTSKPATVVAFDLGVCGGHPAYQAVEWYFPEYGQSFTPDTYLDDCTGSHVGSS